MPGALGGSQPQAKERWAARGAVGWLQAGSRDLAASPQETLAAFSAVLYDHVWAVNLDINAGAAYAPTQPEEELSLFFLIRDSDASGKSSTG